MSTIITVENLSKKYTIGHQKQGEYQTFREALSIGVKSIYQRLCHPLSPDPQKIKTEEFWALKNINFEVKQGDRIGIIGRNGAGKSTLLKILSRITHPTTGKVHIKGRVASLLEVGTGFHPELTGRENIFLNGAILGMTKNDIKLRFDEIVSFAEIEKFLDTPVKRYSSGMHVRLAFAVAAHLEPEILIVDEVLAVGDTTFQKKCLGKMEDVAKGGRTVLFVSHNLVAVQSLCSRAILLNNGAVEKDDKSFSTVLFYNQSIQSLFYSEIDSAPREKGLGIQVRFTECSIVNIEREPVNTLLFSETFKIHFKLSSHDTTEIKDFGIVIGIDSVDTNQRIISSTSEDLNLRYSISPGQEIALSATFEHPVLAPGQYALTMVARHGRQAVLDRVPQCIFFRVVEESYTINKVTSFLAGQIRLHPRWENIYPKE